MQTQHEVPHEIDQFLHGEKPPARSFGNFGASQNLSHGGSRTHGGCSPTGTDRERFAVNRRLIGFVRLSREDPTIRHNHDSPRWVVHRHADGG